MCFRARKCLFRQPYVSRNALRFTLVLFFTRLLYFNTAQRPPLKVYHRFGGRVYSMLPLSILSTPPLLLQGVQKCEIWPRFRHHSFCAAVISKRSYISLAKFRSWCSADGAPFSPNLVSLSTPSEE